MPTKTEAGAAGSSSTAARRPARSSTVQTSTVSDNRAHPYGGGIHAHGSSPVTLVRSTVSGNVVAGAVLVAPEAVTHLGNGGGVSAQHLTVVDSRITGNQAHPPVAA